MELEDRLGSGESYRKKIASKCSLIDPDVVYALLESHVLLKDIAVIYNCSDQTVRKRMKMVDPDFDARKYCLWRETDANVDNMVKKYKRHGSANKVAKLMGLSRQLVTSRLRSAGVNVSTNRRNRCRNRRSEISRETVTKFYSKYKNATAVASVLGTSTGLVIRRLRDAEIELDFSYRHKIRRTDIPQRLVMKLYESGKGLDPLAKQFFSSTKTIRRIVVLSGGKIRKRN